MDTELAVKQCTLGKNSVDQIVSDLLSQIEERRQRELAEALQRMGKLDERQRKVVGDLTSRMLRKMFLPVVDNLRGAAANNETELIEVATKLFKIKTDNCHVFLNLKT